MAPPTKKRTQSSSLWGRVPTGALRTCGRERVTSPPVGMASAGRGAVLDVRTGKPCRNRSRMAASPWHMASERQRSASSGRHRHWRLTRTQNGCCTVKACYSVRESTGGPIARALLWGQRGPRRLGHWGRWGRGRKVLVVVSILFGGRASLPGNAIARPTRPVARRRELATGQRCRTGDCRLEPLQTGRQGRVPLLLLDHCGA